MPAKGYRKQFCPKGHDTFVVGRDKNGYCKQCNIEGARTQYKNNPGKAKEYFKNWRIINIKKVLENIYNWRKKKSR
jgi:hypothetical protein